MKHLLILALTFSLMLLPTMAVAQSSTTGSIEGIITDSNGAVVAGATVTATSTNLIRPRSTATSRDGRYAILALPPGKYKLTVAASGFTVFEQDGIFISLGRTATGDAVLQVAGATARVTITGKTSIDLTQNTTGTSVSAEQFSNFVMARTVGNLYTIAPTVTRSGLRDVSGRDTNPSVAGASGLENNYILDGVNTTDVAFGGAAATLPFEFVQELEIKTGAYGPEYGRATGGIFNVITKSGGNEFHGDVFGYFSTKALLRSVNNFSFSGSAFNGFSEVDAGGDVGGPIVKDKLWFFGAFNPQTRKNYYLTQAFHLPVNNQVSTPFYAGKITWAANGKNTFTFSTFGDYTTVEGLLVTDAPLMNPTGFGEDLTAFMGRRTDYVSNFAFRLNSTFTNNFIGEVSGGIHGRSFKRIPPPHDQSLVVDSFAVLRDGAVLTPVQSGFYFGGSTGFIDYVDGRGGSLQRNYRRGSGFGLYSNDDRNRFDFNAHMQNIASRHTFKWGFEWFTNKYKTAMISSGPNVTYPFTPGLGLSSSNGPDSNVTNGSRITNFFLVCTVRGTVINCPNAAGVSRARAIPTAQLTAMGLTVNPLANPITTNEALNNPFLVRNLTRVNDSRLTANTSTNVESFYFGDDWKFATNWLASFGGRWDYQQVYANGGVLFLKFNNIWDNFAPRFGLTWDFTGRGKGKLFVNYAKFIEVPLPLLVNAGAAAQSIQTNKTMNVDTINAPAGSMVVPGVGTGATNSGTSGTSVDPGLLPQGTKEITGGIEYQIGPETILGARGVYRAMINVIEDGSYDGETYFFFNPGRNGPGTTESAACAGDAASGRAPRCFGRAQRFYRAVEFTATKRFTNEYQFIVSYVYSSLTGNYEGLFRNDNGQSLPNFTSLFDLPSLLDNTYGRLPNDRPHQFKFNGSYRTPWKLMISGKLYALSGTPFNQLIPHATYGNNEGFQVPRGTAIIPVSTAVEPGHPNFVNSTGSTRTPALYSVDLGFNYPLRLRENMDLQLSAAWFNVLNLQRAVTLDQTYSINSGIATVPAVVNPFWGSAVLVQPPSSWRFGAKLRF